MQSALQKCKGRGNCLADSFAWKDQDIKKVSDRLRSLHRSEAVIQELVTNHLRPSGYYQRYANASDAEMLTKSWELCAEGLNHIINTYARGEAGIYPANDSVSFVIDSEFYQNLLQSAMYFLSEGQDASNLFFQPSLEFSLTLLQLNNRDEAARSEPMQYLANGSAMSVIPHINWQDYPYSVILVPGHGPDQENIQLSPLAKLRNNLAAQRYREGKAPLIMVSGGYVHPFQTPYNEALEMKKDLMNRLHIPEQAILIEPHARHTTTNLRNASRIIFNYGIPPKKPALITTTFRQSYYITDMNLDERCQKELGYVPYRIVERLNVHDVVWMPQISALHRNPLDPLDP